MSRFSRTLTATLALIVLSGAAFRTAAAQDIDVDPTTHDFGDVLVGETGQRTITVTNTGLLPLIVSSATIQGGSGRYTITSGANGATLLTGATLEITVRFEPNARGTLVATLRINSNDSDENPFEVLLTGRGLAPEIAVSSGTLSFNDVKVGATRRLDLIITNQGDAPLRVTSASISGPEGEMFEIVPGLLPMTIDPLPAIPRDTLRIDFTPTSGGNKSANLTITNDDPDEGSLIVQLTGRGVRPDIDVAPTSHSFGEVPVGSNVTETFTVTNDGDGPLVISNIFIAGADAGQFSITSGGGGTTLSPGSTRSVNVRFAPTSLGAKEAVLRIESDDPDENPFNVPLTGGSVGLPDISVNPSNSINYGSVSVGSLSIREVIVTNLGNARLTIQQPTISGENPGHFSVTNQDLPFELDFQQRDTLLIAFSPTSPGNKSAFLNVISNDPDESPFTIDIFGVGVRAELVIDMTSYDFGGVALGSSESVTFTLTNTGTGSLNILGATLAGANADEFLITSGGGATTIPPNNARTISVRFTPTSFGQKSATLRIANDVPGENPLNVPLTGTGFGQPDITVNRTVVAYNNVRVGTTSVQEVVIVNTGLATLNVTDAQYGGIDATLFASQPGSLPMALAPTGRDTLRIAFTPLSGGNKSATVSLISNDPDESPLEIFLTGAGVRPGLVVDVTSHDFGEIASGTVATTDFSISNTGTSNLIISLTEIRGTNAADFAIVGGGGAATVAPNNTRVITVAFMPMTPGAKSATLHIESDDISAPVLDLRLSGRGSSIGVDVQSPAASGQDVVVGITLPSGFTASRAQLFYRLAGETIYREATMSIAGSELLGRIPATAVTVSGIEYFISASNDNASITLPSTTPQAAPLFLPVVINEIETPLTFAPLLYRMISVPAILDDPSIRSVLEDDYDVYNTRRWRLFRWEDGDFREYPNIDATFTPGTGFFLVTNDGAPFDVDDGRSVDPTTTLRLDLEPGWNQVGNPYAFQLQWPGAVIDPGIEDPVWFNGREFIFGQTILEPWEGYFVYNSGTTTVSVPISLRTVAAKQSESVVERSASFGSDEFTIRIAAEVPGTAYRDTQNAVGARHAALEGRDGFDYTEPPAIGPHIQLSIVENGEYFAGNFKPLGANGVHWDLELSRNVQGERIDVVLTTEGALPAGSSLHVLDLDDRRALAVRGGLFSIDAPPVGESHPLRLIVGSRDYAEAYAEGISLVPSAFVLEQNYPNPFNPETAISYSIGRPTHVRLAVYDVLGRRIKTLVDAQQESGSYRVNWDATGSNGSPVASGVYLYRLETGEFRSARTMTLLR